MSTVGTALCYYVNKVEEFHASHLITYDYKRSISVSYKASDIVHQIDYWIHVGPTAELRIITISFGPYLKLICSPSDFCLLDFTA